MLACASTGSFALRLAPAQQIMQSLYSYVALLPILKSCLRTAVSSIPQMAVTGLHEPTGHTQTLQLQTRQASKPCSAGTGTLLGASSVLCSTKLSSQGCLQQQSTTLKTCQRPAGAVTGAVQCGTFIIPGQFEPT